MVRFPFKRVFPTAMVILALLFVYQEFMVATDMTAGGSAEDKLRWAFKMYDTDGSGNHRIERHLK